MIYQQHWLGTILSLEGLIFHFYEGAHQCDMLVTQAGWVYGYGFLLGSFCMERVISAFMIIYQEEYNSWVLY